MQKRKAPSRTRWQTRSTRRSRQSTPTRDKPMMLSSLVKATDPARACAFNPEIKKGEPRDAARILETPAPRRPLLRTKPGARTRGAQSRHHCRVLFSGIQLPMVEPGTTRAAPKLVRRGGGGKTNVPRAALDGLKAFSGECWAAAGCCCCCWATVGVGADGGILSAANFHTGSRSSCGIYFAALLREV